MVYGGVTKSGAYVFTMLLPVRSSLWFLFAFKSNNLNCMNILESSRSLNHPPYELQYAVSETNSKAAMQIKSVQDRS